MKTNFSKKRIKTFIILLVISVLLVIPIKNIIKYQNSILIAYNISDKIVILLKNSAEKQYQINMSTWVVKENTWTYIPINTQINIDTKIVDPYNSQAYLYNRDLYFWNKQVYRFYDDYPLSSSSIYWTRDGKYLIKTDMKDYYYLYGMFHKKFWNIILGITELETWKTTQVFARDQYNNILDIQKILGTLN